MTFLKKIIIRDENNNIEDIELGLLIKGLSLIVISFLILLFISLPFFEIVPAGETGVYHLFGNVRDSELRSGCNECQVPFFSERCGLMFIPDLFSQSDIESDILVLTGKVKGC